ncbi:MAG: PD-(D/E)XK nuclease family protein [Methanomicrobiales archaeon]
MSVRGSAGPGPARESVASKYLLGVAGTIKGTIIHEVLQGRDASTVLKEYGQYSEEHVRQCEEIRSAFFSSDLMKRVKRSYCEVPFVVTIDSKRVTGKIDRLCELDDGSRVVLDYKSEVVVFSDYTSLVEEYALSLSIYIMAARQLVGEMVVGRLYFTETNYYQ